MRPNALEEFELPDDVRELVSRCLQGDGTAVIELVDHFRGQVFGLCYRMLRHQQDAEDAAQESFVRAIRSLKRWDPERDFTPWLLAIAGNRCRTQLATRMRRRPGAALPDEVADQRPSAHAASPLEEEVSRALGELRFEYRTAFVLFHEQELSYPEIAAAMNCPIGTAKTWVHRARRDLARALIERGVVEEYGYALRRV
jgi:RNA polymerase sigma-70 factor (ECF subfamily)